MQYCQSEDIIRYTAENARGSEEVSQPVEADEPPALSILTVKNWLLTPARCMGSLSPRGSIALAE